MTRPAVHPAPRSDAARSEARTPARRRGSRLVGLTTSAVLIGSLAACASDDEPSASGASGTESGATATPSAGGSDQPTIVQPGEPGEAASTLPPDAEVPASEFTEDDVAFMQMMIPHHAQALKMCRLAPSRADSPAVRRLAQRIRAAQAPEILSMAAWLQQRSLDVPNRSDDPSEFDHGSHGHDPMMGMLTDAQMRALAAADGVEFDRLFLRGMIGHHQGAIDMAHNVQETGTDVQVSETASDVDQTQTAEIKLMRRLLKNL